MASGNKSRSSEPELLRRKCIKWIILIYFVSGVCSLIDEVVWVRLLKLTLGNTVYAASIVVSMFMGGLALGALIMSRYSDQVKNRLRLYALLETLVTVSALLLPIGLKQADQVYIWFFRAYQPSHWQLLIVQVIISAGLLLVPSMLMGSTLPLLGRFVTSLEKETGHLVGKLYALNTLGAAAGCFLAGFVLIRAFGVMGTLYTAAALNLLVAFGGWFLSRYSEKVEQQADPVAQARAPKEVKTRDRKFYLLIAAFFMSGLISIGYELLWMRSIVHLLGGLTYVFSAVLTIYLLGYVIGVGIGSRLVKRLKNPAGGFAVTLSLLGLCGVFYLPVLILWTAKVQPLIPAASQTLYSWLPISPVLIWPLVICLCLFMAPAIIMGIGFPLALQEWANHVHKVGKSTGTAYGANTLGAVIGGVVTGFVFIPLLGLQISISILGLAGVWIATALWVSFAGDGKAVWRGTFLGGATLLTILAVLMPPNLFDVMVAISNPDTRDELVAVKEGLTTTVSLRRAQNGSLELFASGESIAGDNAPLRADQKALGHFGVLLNTKAKKVLSVGFGSGETTACLAQHELETIDCVEIAPEVVEMSLEYFRHINLGDDLDKRVNMIYMDAKNYLHLSDAKYDVIVNDSIHPRHFAENASLYAKEYFEAAKQRLSDDGIMVSWLPTYKMPQSVFQSIIGTLMDVFPHVTVWYVTPQTAPLVLIVGSKQQQYVSLKHIDDQLLNEGVRDSLAVIGIKSSMDVLSCYLGDERDYKKPVAGFSVNSDYRPFVEFTTDKVTSQLELFTRFAKDVRSDSVFEHIDWTGIGKDDKARRLAYFRKLHKATQYLWESYCTNNWLDKLKYCVGGLEIMPDNPSLLAQKKLAEEALGSGAKRDGREY